MHLTSLDNMRTCYERYVAGTDLERQPVVRVLDVGGADINGSFRDVFSGPQFTYIGADLVDGPGVSVVLDDAYRLPFADHSVEIVLSGQMLEHCEFFWLAFAEMIRVVKTDGYVFVIAPSAGPHHQFPVDCYRFLPDSYRALAKYADCRLVDVWWDARAGWHDLVGVFQPYGAGSFEAPPDPPVPADFLWRDRSAQRAIVHVGTHKTGTTAFQRYLTEWRTELLLEHDILVHRGRFEPSHYELGVLALRPNLETPGRWLLNNDSHAPTEDELRAAVRRTVDADVPTVLFSTEELTYLRTDEEADALAELLSPRVIEPIVVLRKPEDYLASYGATLQRMGFPSAGADHDSAAYVAPDSWLADHSGLLRTLQRLAGSGAPTVIDYDQVMALDGSVIPALWDAMRLPRESLFPGWERHVSVTKSVMAHLEAQERRKRGSRDRTTKAVG